MKRFFFAMFLFSFSALVVSAQNPRVFITDSKSWEISGGGGGTSEGFGGATRGGARPQTAEIIKTFGERCPNVTINNKQEKADYVVLLDHEGGKGVIRKDNKVAVFNWDGDSIVSKSTRSLGNAVGDACDAITKDWAANASKAKNRSQAGAATTAAAAEPTPAGTKSQQAPELVGNVSISSVPNGADIEVDGAFVGNTPSNLKLPAGDHVVSVKKSGYKPWERKIHTTAGDVNLSPELEKGQ